MPFSLMNGISGLGAGMASFAQNTLSPIALEQQKSDLAKQGIVLADQLATAREQNVTQPFEASQQTALLKGQGENAAKVATISGQYELQGRQAEAGAMVGAASVAAAASKYSADIQSKDVYAQLAAAEPERQAVILQQQQQTALAAVNAQNASDLRDAHAALQADPGNSKLIDKVTALEASAGTQATILQAAAAMYRTDLDNVTQLNTRLVAATAAYNSPEQSDTAKAQQQGVINDLKTQLIGAQRALEYSGSLVHGRIAAATNTAPPGTPAPNAPPLSQILKTPGANAAPGAAPTPMPGAGILNSGSGP